MSESGDANMTIKKVIKAMKAAERLKRYCSKHKFCKGCVFYDEEVVPRDDCMIRNKYPEDYDLDKISMRFMSLEPPKEGH